MEEFNTRKLPPYALPEFATYILDAFETLLEEREIDIPNPEKEEAISEGEDPNFIARIYGSDYARLELVIWDTLTKYKLAEDWRNEPDGTVW